MPFQPAFEEDELLSADIEIVISDENSKIGKRVLRLVLTNRAAYWPGSKFFTMGDGITTNRMPLSGVQSVSIRTKVSLVNLICGFLMLSSGLFVLTLVDWNNNLNFGQLKNADAFKQLRLVLGFGVLILGLFLGGLHVLYHGRRQRILIIASKLSKFSWVEPHTFGGGLKAKFTSMLDQVRYWAHSNGLPLEDRLEDRLEE